MNANVRMPMDARAVSDIDDAELEVAVCRTLPDVSVNIRFEGTRGKVEYSGSKVTLEPYSLWRETITPGEIHLYRSLKHNRNFLDCLRSGREGQNPEGRGQGARQRSKRRREQNHLLACFRR